MQEFRNSLIIKAVDFTENCDKGIPIVNLHWPAIVV